MSTGKYYIKLIITSDKCKCWYFKDIEKRNNVYDKLKEKFKENKPNNKRWIEVVVGFTEPTTPTMQLPFRLSANATNEVIDYINSLI